METAIADHIKTYNDTVVSMMATANADSENVRFYRNTSIMSAEAFVRDFIAVFDWQRKVAESTDKSEYLNSVRILNFTTVGNVDIHALFGSINNILTTYKVPRDLIGCITIKPPSLYMLVLNASPCTM